MPVRYIEQIYVFAAAIKSALHKFEQIKARKSVSQTDLIPVG